MLSRCIGIGVGLLVIGLANKASSQTQPSWQEWVKQNPTYPTLPSTATKSPPPAPSSSTQSWDNVSPAAVNDKLLTDKFMQACSEGAPPAYCRCVLEKVKARYSWGQIVDIGLQYQQTGAMPSSLIDMAQLCVARVSQ